MAFLGLSVEFLVVDAGEDGESSFAALLLHVDTSCY